jgi:hypothetical protein
MASLRTVAQRGPFATGMPNVQTYSIGGDADAWNDMLSSFLVGILRSNYSQEHPIVPRSMSLTFPDPGTFRTSLAKYRLATLDVIQYPGFLDEDSENKRTASVLNELSGALSK